MPPKPGRPKKPDFLQPTTCPDCGATFKPVNINQKRCVACIAKINKQAKIKAEIEAMHKKHPPANHNPVGMATCVVCGKEFEAKNLRNAKYCSDECKKSVKTKTHWNKKETISDNQKLVWVRCKNPECPNGGKFQTTWEKYRKGAAYCDKDCNYRAKYLQSKKYQRDQEEKRAQVPAQVVEIDYTPHAMQKLMHASQARFKVVIAGARGGKDRGMINEYIAKFAGMLSENRPSTLVPRVHGFIVCPTYPLSNQVWRELKHFFPKEWVVNKNEAEHRIETVGGGIIEIKTSSDPDSLVSVGLDCVLISEAARVRDLEYTWSYLRGRLASPGRGPGGKGGIALINSTPKGRTFLYQMYLWGQDPNFPEWESWMFPTSANPYVDPKEIEEARKTLPERMFRQEFLGEFLEDGGEVFPNVDSCANGEFREPDPGRVYVIGFDPARSVDFSGIIIRDNLGQAVYVDRWTGMPWTWQVDQIELLAKKYNHAKVIMDRTGLGETLVEAITQRGVSCEGVFLTNAIKEQLVNHLAYLMERRMVCYPDVKYLQDELKQYEYTVTKTGKISYSAPVGAAYHDDMVCAMFLAYRDYDEAVNELPYVGLLLGGRRKSA